MTVPPPEGADPVDRAKLEARLVNCLPALEGYIRVRMGPRLRALESSSDIAQSVAREAVRDLSGFDYRGDGALQQWLYQRARFKIFEHVRRFRLGRDAGAPESGSPAIPPFVHDVYLDLVTPSRNIAAAEAVARIEAALDALPSAYREAIAMHRILGMTHAEIAAQLGRSEGAVRNLVYRGLSRLALALGLDQ